MEPVQDLNVFHMMAMMDDDGGDDSDDAADDGDHRDVMVMIDCGPGVMSDDDDGDGDADECNDDER